MLHPFYHNNIGRQHLDFHFSSLLVHLADVLHIDTTFKRALGSLKEVEFVMWLPAVQHGKMLSHYEDILWLIHDEQQS